VNHVTALDLSLDATGIAKNHPEDSLFLGTLSTKLTGMDRLDWIFQNVIRHCEGADLVVIERMVTSRFAVSVQERSGLWFLVSHELWKRDVKVVPVAPSQIKKFVTGKGIAEKSVMVREVWRNWQIEAAGDDEADAAGMLKIGECLLGAECRTQAQRDVVATLLGGPKKMPAMAEASW